jgi:hypothetical protein
LIQNALTYEDERASLRYIRRRSANIPGAVADIRKAKRAAENDGGTGLRTACQNGKSESKEIQ